MEFKGTPKEWYVENNSLFSKVAGRVKIMDANDFVERTGLKHESDANLLLCSKAKEMLEMLVMCRKALVLGDRFTAEGILKLTKLINEATNV